MAHNVCWIYNFKNLDSNIKYENSSLKNKICIDGSFCHFNSNC